MSHALTLHEITTLDDPLYDDYLDLYQASFPLNEQTLVSEHNRALRERMRGGACRDHIVVALDEDGSVAGLARYALEPECTAGVLWYLAVRPDLRGRGAGAELYGMLVRRVRDEMPDAKALVFEVERADCALHPEQASFAERRIRFYQRNGALLLKGIEYLQSTGWQPALPMHLMVHPFRQMDAEEAFALCVAAFGETVRRAGDPALQGASEAAT